MMQSQHYFPPLLLFSSREQAIRSQQTNPLETHSEFLPESCWYIIRMFLLILARWGVFAPRWEDNSHNGNMTGSYM